MIELHIESESIKPGEIPIKRLAKVYVGHNSATVNLPKRLNNCEVIVVPLSDEMQEKAREQDAARDAQRVEEN